MTLKTKRHATALETISIVVPEEHVEIFENALGTICPTVGIFEEDPDQNFWRLEGIKDVGYGEEELKNALTLATNLTGIEPQLDRHATKTEGWLARTYEAFPEQEIGKRFIIRGTHLEDVPSPSHLVLTLDAGVAFGSGEHGSTRGCLIALEKIAHTNPRNILDLGCGSGILAMAAAALLHKKVLAVDIEPWSVRAAKQNVIRNGLRNLIVCEHGNGWLAPSIRKKAPFDLVFANILARPLCKMAKNLAINLAPGGKAILAGLLKTQIPMVLGAHQRQGLKLQEKIIQGSWATLILYKPEKS
ncbi:50S ribosomal protein L11 methyltransferase [Commensalibacter oyaizuii]|uniref:Ribosomal protein L11 methyltransferase n=1 Tax=Commensalibacter oyaizuii TaxID=3043873 RepID=A0ABT6PZB9_9PROT|nr:50S ribosomal protein L11 methyltransferase [Commensalibacter sp. TBRC 16381]MDI2090202.1 50S ribosomal protein L11 methyltransferase [Commensalibacter sp. TBRC 16381]